MISELVALRKRLAELERERQKFNSFDEERKALEADIEYWKNEVKRVMVFKEERDAEKRKRLELKLVFDSTYKQLRNCEKLANSLRVERTQNERIRSALQDKNRLLEHDIETEKRKKEFEQTLRLKAEKRAAQFEHRFNDERAQRLQNLHKFNKEQVKVAQHERKEREAVKSQIQAQTESSNLEEKVQILYATLTADRNIMESLQREIDAHVSELENAKRECILHRRAASEKDERITQEKLRYLELEKELWRIQRLAESRDSVNTRPMTLKGLYITKPSDRPDPSLDFDITAAGKAMAQHREEQGLKTSSTTTSFTTVDTYGAIEGDLFHTNKKRPSPKNILKKQIQYDSNADHINIDSLPDLSEPIERDAVDRNIALYQAQQSKLSKILSNGLVFPEKATNYRKQKPSPQKTTHKNTLHGKGSLFLGSGLGLIKPSSKDIFESRIPGSPKQMVKQIIDKKEAKEAKERAEHLAKLEAEANGDSF